MQFEREPTVSSEELTKDRLPRKEIGLGLALLILGLTFFFICFLHHRGHTREHIKEGSVSRDYQLIFFLRNAIAVCYLSLTGTGAEVLSPAVFNCRGGAC